VTRIAVTSPPIMRTSTSYGISADSNNYFKSVATSTPIGCPSRSSGTASTERKRVLSWASLHVYSRSAKTSGTWTVLPSSKARPPPHYGPTACFNRAIS
jgi:hypothetical protein